MNNTEKLLADALRPFAELLFEPHALHGEAMQLHVMPEDVSRAQHALAVCEAMKPTDPQDIAFLAIGADEAWRAAVDANWQTTPRPDCFDGFGQDGVIAEVIRAADILAHAWPGNEWTGGVWYYEVSEPLGAWVITEWVARGACPDDESIAREAMRLIAVAEGRHPGPGAPGKAQQS